MNLGQAIEHLKAGRKMARRCWAEKGIHLEMAQHGESENAEICINGDGEELCGLVLWNPSSADTDATDWEVVD
jgi:hypothetical protein